MDKICFIIEDLLPLYNEKLLSDETTIWVESHLKECDHCKELANISKEPLPKDKIESTVDYDVLFKKINRKVSIYQIIFVALSFFFAIKTSLVNNSFGFILWYAVLGTITYLFYKDMKITFLISFIPIFIWSFTDSMGSFVSGNVAPGTTLLGYVLECLQGAFFISFIHYLFTMLGSIIGLLIIKIRGHENEKE